MVTRLTNPESQSTNISISKLNHEICINFVIAYSKIATIVSHNCPLVQLCDFHF